MSESKWWVSLYDPDDRLIASYHVDGSAKIDAMTLTWALRHPSIEYVKLTVNPPDESGSDETA